MRKHFSAAYVCLSVLASVLLALGEMSTLQFPKLPGTLKRVVILSRHGVRSPTQDSASLNSWRANPTLPWPDFQTHTGYLTDPQGINNAEVMGGYYRTQFFIDLFGSATCPDRLFIWADRDERTVMTAQALGTGFLGNNSRCNFGVYESAEESDPIFHPTAISSCVFDAAKVKNSVDLNGLDRRYGQRRDLAQSILGCCSQTLCQKPCSGSSRQSCGLKELPSCVQADPKNASIVGSWAISQSFGEILLLEYAQGFSGPEFGFGKANEGLMLKILPMHTGVFNTLQRDGYVAERQGSNLLYHIAYAMQDGHDPSVPAGDYKILFYVGHDTNIANIGQLLDLHWSLTDYPDDPDEMPPGGALIFEVREVGFAPNTQQNVYAFFLAQSPDELRQVLPPTNIVAVPIPGCEKSGVCSLSAFEKLAQTKYLKNQECLSNWQPPKAE